MVNFFKKFSTIFTIVIIVLAVVAMTVLVSRKVYHKIKRMMTLSRYSPSVPVDFKDDVRVFTASSLDRIFQDGKTLVKPQFAKTAYISAAANEYESFQIVIQSKVDLHNVYLNVSDLKNEQGGLIPSSNITWRVEGYVPTIQPYYPVRYVGPWPDPLMSAKKTTITSKVTQPFWITVYIPVGTKPGLYQGNITVIAGNLKQDIPVTVKVYNFEIPQQNHLKTAFDFYGHLTKARYPQGKDEPDALYLERINELNDRFITTMIQYRQDPVLNIDPTSNDDLARIDRYMVYGLNNFAIGKHGGTFDNNWPKNDDEIEALLPTYQTYGEALKMTQLLPYTYIYTWDEGEIGNPWVPKVASMIHRAYPGLKNMVCYHGLWDPDLIPNWGKDIDIWCFNIDDFNETLLRRLQKMGMEMWMYVSGPNASGTPNFVLDSESIDYRIIPWICWKYDIKGFLYWCVNWWGESDPFETAKNTKWEQNGNGLLFYPAANGPIISIRSEIFRDGMEDYEYIQLLFNDLKSLKAKGLVKAHQRLFDDAVRLLTMDSSIAQSTNHFVKDQTVLIARRNAIAEKIEEINHILSLP